VEQLTQLFQAYNQVLWAHFHYCRDCGGQCCVVDAADIRPFDLLALALLDQVAPVLPDVLATQARACIYLAGQQCSWPASWRTIKCWSFYCLGSGPWPPAAPLVDWYHTLTLALQQVVQQWLPAPLRQYEAVHGITLAHYLDDPVDFSNRFHAALGALFVEPLNQRYPCVNPALPVPSTPQPAVPQRMANIVLTIAPDEETLALIGLVIEELVESPPVLEAGRSVDALLVDLETLTWIVESQPAQSQRLLQEMNGRYPAQPALVALVVPPGPIIPLTVTLVLAHLRAWVVQQTTANSLG
jgi:hypothetical protein